MEISLNVGIPLTPRPSLVQWFLTLPDRVTTVVSYTSRHSNHRTTQCQVDHSDVMLTTLGPDFLKPAKSGVII